MVSLSHLVFLLNAHVSQACLSLAMSKHRASLLSPIGWRRQPEQTPKSRPEALQASTTWIKSPHRGSAEGASYFFPNLITGDRRGATQGLTLEIVELKPVSTSAVSFGKDSRPEIQILTSPRFQHSNLLRFTRHTRESNEQGRSDFHRHPPRQSALRQDLAAGSRSSHTSLYSPREEPPPLQAERE